MDAVYAVCAHRLGKDLYGKRGFLEGLPTSPTQGRVTRTVAVLCSHHPVPPRERRLLIHSNGQESERAKRNRWLPQRKGTLLGDEIESTARRPGGPKVRPTRNRIRSFQSISDRSFGAISKYGT